MATARIELEGMRYLCATTDTFKEDRSFPRQHLKREERERRRDEEDCRAREEQARLAREEEERRLAQEEKREADREAKMARILRESMEEMGLMKKDGATDASKMTWDKVDPPQKEGDASKNGEGGDSKKRDQGAMAGPEIAQQLGTGRPRVESTATPLDTGLIRMDINTVRLAQDAQAAMFKQMLNCLEAIRQQGAGIGQAPAPVPNQAPPSHPSPPPPVPISNQAPPSHPPPPPPVPQTFPAATQAPFVAPPPMNSSPNPTPQAPPKPPAHVPSTPAATLAPCPSVTAAGPSTSRARPANEGTPAGGRFSSRLAGMFASVAGHNTRRRSNGISISDEPVHQDLGFDRINKGKKAAVAGLGKEGRKKYIEDLTEVLFNKSKHKLEELCKQDKIKYVNKKITSAALAQLQAIDAYGEDEEEEESSEEDAQEENPS
ncbi:hypothetical protein CBR_g58 [Chara braunii]|uniref:Uncharacterized protein n=1 Tax=Chara braunii TaxID=69332 RepID=A0A388JLG2_CHABU|nr:hypothetical protein CBR_g58 [Chara braunii]|eukprot:GBG58657.1 hypothetical protein CBR_g58 [Chara braunii]